MERHNETRNQAFAVIPYRHVLEIELPETHVLQKGPLGVVSPQDRL